MKPVIPKILNIQRFCTHDGPGTRTVIFLKGCPLRCLWCSNPESQSPDPEILFDAKKCIGCGRCTESCPASIPLGAQGVAEGCTLCGACIAACPAQALEPAGREYTVEELVAEAVKDELYYREGGGVTISGGEPLLYPGFVCALAKALRRQGDHVALETTGFADWKTADRVFAEVDLVLYDIKHIDDEKHRLYTGVSNDRILENARRALERGYALQIRVPLLGGLNDDLKTIRKLAAFCVGAGVGEVEFLPYHNFGQSKYEMLRRQYNCEAATPDLEHRKTLARLLESEGVGVKIGR